MKKAHILVSIVSLSACVAAQAQQQLSTEVVVDRTVDTPLPAARPLPSVMPSLYSMPLSGDSLTLSERGADVTFSPMAPPDDNDIYAPLDAPDKSKAYVWAGYFPVYNVKAASGYSLLSTQSSMLRLGAAFDGMSYTNDADAAVKGHLRKNVTSVGLQGRHASRNTLLQLKANYDYTNLKAPDDTHRYTEHGINRTAAQFAVHHSGSKVSVDLDLHYNYTGIPDELTYMVQNHYGFNELVKIKGVVSSDLGLSFGLKARMSSKATFNLKLSGDYTYEDGIRPSTYIYPIEQPSSGVFSFEPSVDLKYSKFKSRIGLKAFGGTGDYYYGGRIWLVTPDLHLQWEPLPKASLYATLTGGRILNPINELYEYSPYALGATSFRPVLCALDWRIGLRAGSFAGLSAEVFAGLVGSYNYLYITCTTPGYGGSIGSDKAGGPQIGFNVKYSLRRLLSVSVEGSIANGDRVFPDRLNLDRAKMLLSAHLQVRPIERLTAGIDYTLRSARQYSSYPDDVDMGDLSRLDVYATFAVTDRFSVFARLDNLFNNKVLLMPMIQTQGFSGLIGAGYKF